VRIQPVNGAPTIDRIELTSTAQVAGLDNAAFQKIAEVTKANCPVSRVLKAEIVLTATLKS
jgi:osmotically inducible protein OsmC